VERVRLAAIDWSGCGREQRGEQRKLTLRYSFDASCHSLFMVLGPGLANERMVAKRAKLTPMPMKV
jgi:hypothetical protein